MRLITIYENNETVQTVEGKMGGARLEYTVRGQLEIYLSGGFTDNGRELIPILACTICQDMHIPLTMLTTIFKPGPKRMVLRHPNSRPLF